MMPERDAFRRATMHALPRLALLAAIAVAATGCVALSYVAPISGRLDNASDQACASSLSQELIAALEKQGEAEDDAKDAAGRAVRLLGLQTDPSPAKFEAASSSGVTYWFLFQPKDSGCMLKLFERDKDGGYTSNTITYYAKRQLTGCTCSWNLIDQDSE